MKGLILTSRSLFVNDLVVQMSVYGPAARESKRCLLVKELQHARDDPDEGTPVPAAGTRQPTVPQRQGGVGVGQFSFRVSPDQIASKSILGKKSTQ